MSSKNTNNNAASAAAMDALDLDDLFYDDPNDTFFDDMDMDLGDISGVFNEGVGDVMTQEFGRSGSLGSSRATDTIQSSAHQPVGKKRGSKVALTHAQIMANLGIKKQDDKAAKPAAPPVEKDEGTITQRVRRTRRGARSSGNKGSASKNSATAVSKGEDDVAESKSNVSPDVVDAINAVAKYGIRPSTEFYPFMRLPHEVEIKKGQKAFPCLEKINHAPHKHLEIDSTLNDTSTSHTPLHRILSMSHPGSHNDLDFDKALLAATQKAASFLNPTHPMFASLKGDLSKLLLIVMKQSAFLRQNLWNMEAYSKQNMSETEFNSIFAIRRKDIEEALTRVGGDGVQSLLSSQAPKKPEKSSVKSNATVKPMVYVKVKVRVQGWRDKSGRKLVGRFNPPKEWKVATRKAKNLANKRQQEEDAAAAAIAPKPVRPAVLKAVAKELLQVHQLVRTDKKKPESSDAPKKASTLRKRKSSTMTTSTIAEAPKTSVAKLTPTTPFFDLFHVPSYKSEPTATIAPISSSKTLNNDEQPLSNTQQSRLAQVLHTKILHPSLTPTERRALLAKEISATIERVESARKSKQLAKAQEIQKEIKALEDICKKDLETVPEVANTVGFWRWISETAYFRDMKKEDVYDALDYLISASESNVDSSGIEDGKLWGSLLPPAHVRAVTQDDGPYLTELSPLFDCLQSLLVEVDGSDDESDDEELLANLPPFTAEQLIHGPDSTDVANEDVLDISALSLDQRTYLQLRAAGLIDASSLPSKPPCLIEEESSPQNRQCLSTSNMDDVIKRMKSDLLELDSTNRSAALILQRAALSAATQSSTLRKQVREQETILNKYNELKKDQNEQREKKRVSGRVKTGPSKFDGDNWMTD